MTATDNENDDNDDDDDDDSAERYATMVLYFLSQVIAKRCKRCKKFSFACVTEPFPPPSFLRNPWLALIALFLVLRAEVKRKERSEQDNCDIEHLQHISPPQHPLLGFKDRNLESNYLDDLARNCRTRITLGFILCVLLVLVGPIMQMASLTNLFWDPKLQQAIAPLKHIPKELESVYDSRPDVPDNNPQSLSKYMDIVRKENKVSDFLPAILSLVIFAGGLTSTFFVKNRAIYYVAEATYLAYTAVHAYNCHYMIEMRALITGMFPIGTFAIGLALYGLPPFLGLFMMNLPLALTLEIIVAALVVFLLIIPFLGEYNYWNDFEEDYIENYATTSPGLEFLLSVDHDKSVKFFQFAALMPLFLITIMALFIMVSSFFTDRGFRRAFANKKIIALLSKMREKNLTKQKEDHEMLVNSIFPRAIATNLMKRQATRAKDGERLDRSYNSDSDTDMRATSFLAPSRLGSHLAW